MRLGQVILLAAVVGFGVYTTRLRSTLSDRIAYLLCIVVGVPLVLYPDWSTRVAHVLGIGRGVDLVIYLFIAFSLFFYASTAAHRRRFERNLTLLVRQMAIDSADRDRTGLSASTGEPPSP